MARSSFIIRSVESKVVLSDDGIGEATFSVHNTSGRPIIPGRAELVTEISEAKNWLSLEGGSSLDFAKDTTQQYKALISVPKDAPSGVYAFRLNMISEDRPDNDFTEGPLVKFTVEENGDQEVESKSPWLWISLALATLGFLVSIGLFLWHILSGDPSEEELNELRVDMSALKISLEEQKQEGQLLQGALSKSIIASQEACKDLPGSWVDVSVAAGQFLLGKKNNVYRPGVTGGQAKVTLTRAQIPTHTHKLPRDGAPTGKSQQSLVHTANKDEGLYGSGPSTGGGDVSGKSHENMPPYLVVNFCQLKQ